MPILKIHKNALYVNNELVKFQFEIDTVLVLDSQVIVLIKTPYDIDNNDNVYSVDFHGKITWQIESAKKRFPKLQYTPYVGLSYKNGVDDSANYFCHYSADYCNYCIILYEK